MERADEAPVLDAAAHAEVGAEVGAVGVEHVPGGGAVGGVVAPDDEVVVLVAHGGDRLVGQLVEAADGEPAVGQREREALLMSGLGSLGRPRARSPMRLRWICSVPPPMRDDHWPRNMSCSRP